MANSSLEQQRWIGSDLVRIEGGVLAIYSKRDMPDWVVREFCQPAIWFQDQKFFLCSKESVAAPRRWRYGLRPWPEHEAPSAPYSIFYSAEYVADRERNFRSGLAGSLAYWLLLPLCPALGFLWSGTKERLASIGFVPRSVTVFSITIELGAMLVLGILIGYLGFWSIRNVLAFLILTLDLVMRYDAILRDHPRSPGFFEWCFRS